MDFSLTNEQMDIQRAAEAFAKGEFDPEAALELDEKQQFPKAVWEKACGLGFVGILFPEECGGPGFGVLENTLVTEVFCRQDSGIGMALALSDFGSEIILRRGDEDQKHRTLPHIAQGKALMTAAYLEEGHSLTPMSTSARRDGEGFILEGTKAFVTLGKLARFMVVVCQSGPEDAGALSVILLETGSDHMAVTGMGEKLGMRMVPVDRITFTQTRIGAENGIGQEGKGSFYLREFLDEVSIEAGAMGVGIAQGALDRALDYGKKREQFGRPLVGFDAIRNKLADMYLDVEMARLLTNKAAWLLDQGRGDSRSAILAKTAASRTAYRVTYEALQIHGGLGYMKEGHIERFFRDARVLDLFLEPGKVQRRLLADEITRKRRWK